jgi:hypothetical protein
MREVAPAEFGAAGPNWADVGWKIDVRFTPVASPVRRADHMRLARGRSRTS